MTQSSTRLRSAKRMADIEPFHVVELLQRAKILEAAGRSVVHMEVGEPDFPTAQPLLDAAMAFLQRGQVRYTPSLGIAPLREASAASYAARHGVSVDPRRIVVTAGASGALLLAVAALVGPGDEVLLTDPGYPCNRHFVRAFEGVAKAMPVFAETGYQPTAAQADKAWTPATRALLVASPANPTGTLIEDSQLDAIAQIAQRRNGALLVDEIYHGLTYGCDARTALQLPGEVFVINSFSKYFGMTGWRLGWLVVPEAYLRDIEKLAQNLFIAPSAPAQYAALAAFTPEATAIFEDRRREFARRRDYLLAALEALGFRIGSKPAGAFYLYADSAALAADSHELAWSLLEEAGVAITPGIDFGANAPERHVRFAYTTALGQLKEGVARIARHLANRDRPACGKAGHDLP